LECQVHLASTCLKQGAPAIPKAHRTCGPQVDFDNARRQAHPWNTRGGLGGGRAWVSESLQPLSECGCSSQRRKTAPPSGWLPGGGISLACALHCWAFGYFGRRAGALEEMRPQKPAPRVQVFTCTRFSTNSLSSQSSYVRRATPSFVMLVRPRTSSWHDLKGASSTGDCGVRRWCMARDTAE
jgi:hypothetical protein